MARHGLKNNSYDYDFNWVAEQRNYFYNQVEIRDWQGFEVFESLRPIDLDKSALDILRSSLKFESCFWANQFPKRDWDLT